ncbi:MAG: YibE/F family protein, partial [Candidatus Pacebacteria bacterium]|nr:YibE/F family protein [Candidatus Paceibacterota bacterium]
MKKLLPVLILGFIALQPLFAHAQTLVPEQITTMKAQVVKVTSQDKENVAGTSVTETVQMLDVKILDGAEQGKTVTVENDYTTFKVGDVLYLTHDVDTLEGMDMYSVADAYRLPWLYGLVALFVICVLIFGGKQGFRGLIALVLSFLAIAYLLFPGILHGFSPVLMSIG